MRRKNVILMSLAIVLPLATAIDVKPVKGSEPPGRLVNNGDGTVTDTVTNLVWQQAGTNLVTDQGDRRHDVLRVEPRGRSHRAGVSRQSRSSCQSWTTSRRPHR